MKLCAKRLFTVASSLCVLGSLCATGRTLALNQALPAPTSVQTATADPGSTKSSDTAPPQEATAVAPEATYSAGVNDVLKLVRSGVGQQTVLAFVESSPIGYRLTADEIIRLHKSGIPSEITAAMIQHGSEIRARMNELVSAASGAAAQQQAQAPVYAPNYSSPPPVYAAPQYVYPEVSYASYPTYGYLSSPNYGFVYPYSSWSGWYGYPLLSFSFGSSHFSRGRSFYASHNSFPSHGGGNGWHGSPSHGSGGGFHGSVGGHFGSGGGSFHGSGGGSRGGRGGGPRGH